MLETFHTQTSCCSKFQNQFMQHLVSFPTITRTGFWHLPSHFQAREAYGLTREMLPWLGGCKVPGVDFTSPECINQTEAASPELPQNQTIFTSPEGCHQTIPTSPEYQNQTMFTSPESANHTISTSPEWQNHTISTPPEFQNQTILTFPEYLNHTIFTSPK